MNKKMKRNLLILTVVVFVSAAAYLNWNYSKSAADVGKILGESTLVSGSGSVLEEGPDEETFAVQANYFDTARLNRQEARDNALALLREAAAQDGAKQETKDAASAEMKEIADFTQKEATIENLVMAKGYSNCVAFVGKDSASVVLDSGKEELEKTDIAKVTDIVMKETNLTADKIKIMQAK